jgi:protein-L-isoaspartate(D-aspartate) O-methyltransferase
VTRKTAGDDMMNTGHEYAMEEAFAALRQAMVRDQLQSRGVSDELVLSAMGSVPRHRFVPGEFRDQSYTDRPLPIGYGQTISQPYIIALMTQLLRLTGGGRILEIGTGSGYQAAVLAEIADEVFTVEINAELERQAGERLEHLGYTNIHLKLDDGYSGWPEHAPYDGIVVTAAPTFVPKPLVRQLQKSAIMVIPVGDLSQELLVVKRVNGDVKESVIPVQFVPMTGEVERKEGGENRRMN